MAKHQFTHFDPALLDEVRDRTPLPELVGRAVELKRSGRALTGCCPFHGESTPSFQVYEKHFHCFGCSAHGDVIDFVRKLEKVSFPDAVRRLASEAGIQIPGADRPALTVQEEAARAEAAADRQRRAEAKAIVDAQEREKREGSISKRAEGVWSKGQDLTEDHPYLARKGIEPHGLKVDAKGRLLVPMRDEDDKLWNLQTIDPDGRKMTLWRKVAGVPEGGRVKGLHHAMGEIDGAPAVIIAEGMATAASIREATGLPVRVAFTANNLEHVARSLRERNPELPILIAADNDHHKPRLDPPKANIGLEKAEFVAKAVPNVAVIAPRFKAEDAGKDWNDYSQQHGKAAVKAAFDAALKAPSPNPTLTQETKLNRETVPAPPATVPDLVKALERHAKGNPEAETYVSDLKQELASRSGAADEREFRRKVVVAVKNLREAGVEVDMAEPLRQELRVAAAPSQPAAKPADPSAATSPPQQEQSSKPSPKTDSAPGPAAISGQTSQPTSPPLNPSPGQWHPQTAERPQQPQQGQAQIRVQTPGVFTNAMASIYNAMRTPEAATPPQWEQPPHPLGDRLSAYEQQRAGQITQRMVQEASAAGLAAQRALEALGSGPGSAVLGQIRQAAQNEPGGIQTVVGEMQPGGKYADLRSAFNSTLVQERAFAAAYERAIGGIGAYGEARVKLNDSFASRQMDVTALNRQFDTMDRTIAEASQAIPGRKEGKSAYEEIAEKAAKVGEFLKSVVDRVRNAVAPGTAPAPTAAPTTTPVPAMSL